MANGIAIKVDEELLRDIHVRAAKKGLSTQQYLSELIERDLFPKRFPEQEPERFLQLTDDQKTRLRDAVEAVNQAVMDVEKILWDGPEQTAGGMTMAP